MEANRITLDQLQIEQIFDDLPDGVFICDKQGTILYVNEANTRLLGISAKDCVGSNIANYVSTEFTNVITQNVLNNKSAFSSIMVPKKTGLQLLEFGAPIKNRDGEIIGCIVIDRDLSEINNLMEQLKQSESKIARYEKSGRHHKLVIEQLIHQANIQLINFSDIMYSKSPTMINTFSYALNAAKTDVTVLLTGETGVGKEIIANYIFENSGRNKNPFIKVNCAAIPSELLESELFGYVKGAFTGADPKGKPGLFELANNGTLYLDEIGELPLDFQPKLLRALQQQEITRVGDTKPIKLDLRIISATNRNLEKMVSDGSFRGDLYYRLSVFPLHIPALRERKEDIIDFANHFLKIYNKKYQKNILLAEDTKDLLLSYDWPGNIREMENLLERWVIISPPYATITKDMSYSFFDNSHLSEKQSDFEGFSFKELVSQHEKEILLWASKKCKSTREMAKVLNMDHSTIVKKAKKYHITIGKKAKN